MHYLGFVIVDEPTPEAVGAAIEPYFERCYDWLVVGGRWDGWFEGEEGMKSRAKAAPRGHYAHLLDHHIKRNCRRVADLSDETPEFFVIPEEGWFGSGDPSFEKDWAALRANSDLARKWAIVVDAHS